MSRRLLLLGVLLAIALGLWATRPAMQLLGRRLGADTKAMVGTRAPDYSFSFGSVQGDQGVGAPLSITGWGNEIFVTDGEKRRVNVYAPNGAFKRAIGEAEGPGALSYPFGMAIENGKLYVTDMKDAQINIYNISGKFQDAIGTGKLVKPTDIKIHKGRIYVADAGKHAVIVMDRDGKVLQEIGRQGYGLGQFRYPNGIAFDPSGKMYVADSGNNRVQIFDAEGRYLKTIYDAAFPLVAARSMVIENNTLFVVAGLTNRISAFDLEGTPKFRIGADAGKAGELNLPSGMYMDDEGKLYVTELGYKRISVFR